MTSRLFSRSILFAVVLGFQFLAAYVLAAQPKVSTKLRRAISTDQFTLLFRNDLYLLSFRSPEGAQSIPINKIWLVPEALSEDEDFPYSTVLYSKHVTSFPIGNGEIALQFSSYDIMPEGSMMGAGGRDVFLIFNPASHSLRPGLVDLGITKERYRDEGCFSALMTHFLVADANQDGNLDIGLIKEEIKCPPQDDWFNRASYVQHVLHWYLFTPLGWRKEEAGSRADIGWTDAYAELPLIDLSLSPVDFVGALLWGTYDTSRWLFPPTYTPAYRHKLLLDEKRKPSSTGAAARTPKVRFEQPLKKPED